jgi:enoyl-CoA hydratase/carnithine racemase
MAQTIRYERDGGSAVVTLARPERRNALSMTLMQELTAQLAEIGLDSEVRVVILASDGKVFSSGHDLNEMQGRDLAAYRETFEVCTRLMEMIQAIPQPVVAEVQGLATAAGCQLVAACDLAVASEDAAFATPGVKIGLFCTTPMIALSRAIGRKRAMEMLLTGRLVSAREAADWGLVNNVVPAQQLRTATRQLAAQISEASPLTVSTGKRAFYSQIDLAQEKAYDYAQEVMSMNAIARDAQEGISAFLEKRRPHWTGQ